MSLKHFDRLEYASTINNGAASIPMLDTGDDLLFWGRQFLYNGTYGSSGESVVERVFSRAVQSYSISTAQKDLYFAYAEKTSLEAPKLSTFRLLPNLNKLPKYSAHLSLHFDSSEKLETIKSLLKLALEIADGNTLYAPYFLTSDDPESQIEITEQIAQLSQVLSKEIMLLEQGASSTQLKLVDEISVIIVNSVVRAHLIPTSVAVNTEKSDFDSGHCDKYSNTSFRRGDRIVVSATYQNYFLVFKDGSYGWVKKQDIGFLNEGIKDKLLHHYEEMFYIGSEPFFFKSKEFNILLPGDSVFANGDGFYVLESDNSNNITFYKLDNINPKLFVFGPVTLQQVMEFLYNLKLPYMFSVFDCSEVIRRSFNLLNCSLRKYSADLMQDLGQALGEQDLITMPSQLNALEPGLYLANLLAPNGSNQYMSRHIYIITVNDENVQAFSYAFSILDDAGNIEYPIGPHICSRGALEHQINKGRHLAFQKIAFA